MDEIEQGTDERPVPRAAQDIASDGKNPRADEAPDPDRLAPRRFWLFRHHDVSGVSGTGVVAEGTLWSSGQVALHWPGQPTATSLWASLDDLLSIHGHGGHTTVEWLDKGNDWHSEYRECDEGMPPVELVNGAIWIH